MRQVVLDTETTGLDWERGHRIIEIGCVEIVNRRQTGETYHRYINPQREVDAAAQEVHGLSSQDLTDKPLFSEVVESFLEFIADAELIIHNAPFDVGFIDNELGLAKCGDAGISGSDLIVDTLQLARRIHPGQRNSLDALCKRYGIDNSRRDLHGALLDARLLAEVYLAMTGGQGALLLGDSGKKEATAGSDGLQRIDRSGLKLKVVRANQAELDAHEMQLDLIDGACAEKSVWRRSGA